MVKKITRHETFGKSKKKVASQKEIRRGSEIQAVCLIFAKRSYPINFLLQHILLLQATSSLERFFFISYIYLFSSLYLFIEFLSRFPNKETRLVSSSRVYTEKGSVWCSFVQTRGKLRLDSNISATLNTFISQKRERERMWKKNVNKNRRKKRILHFGALLARALNSNLDVSSSSSAHEFKPLWTLSLNVPFIFNLLRKFIAALFCFFFFAYRTLTEFKAHQNEKSNFHVFSVSLSLPLASFYQMLFIRFLRYTWRLSGLFINSSHAAVGSRYSPKSRLTFNKLFTPHFFSHFLSVFICFFSTLFLQVFSPFFFSFPSLLSHPAQVTFDPSPFFIRTRPWQSIKCFSP